MRDDDHTADFFICHADADVPWAEWIAEELEGAGYGVVLKSWDFRPGHNLLAKLDEALAKSRHTLCLLSDAGEAVQAAAQAAAQLQEVEGKDRALIPVLLAECERPPLLAAYVSMDLCNVDEDEARRRLLAGVADRAERVASGGFPGAGRKATGKQVRFPAAAPEAGQLRGQRPNPHFVGRDDDLKDLYRAFRANRPTSAIQAITGLGGLGKTQLAIQYACRYGNAYDVVWWVRAEDPTTLRGDYAELAKELGLPFDQDDQAIPALRQTLRRRGDWLLIFDNAEDPEQIFPLLPDRLTGHVLITSQLRNWRHAETRHLEVLPTAAAVEYLQRKGKVTNADTARELAEALGGLPLALAQAAGVIAEGMSAADYLAQLQRQSPELFTRGRDGDNEATIASTWRVSFERLASQSVAAVALLRLAAFLGAEAIPLSRLAPVPDMPADLAEALADPLRRHDVTRVMGQYSLADTEDGLLSLHRMVQAVTRTDLGEEEPRWAGVALATVAAAFPDDVRDPKIWPDCEAMLAHAVAAAQHTMRLNVAPVETTGLLERVARYLLQRGRLDHSESVIGDALAVAGRLPDGPEYLRCRNTHGLLLLAQGRLTAALEAQEEVYEARVRTLGPDHIDTLRSGRDLVEALYRQGHLTQAKRLQDHLVHEFAVTRGAKDLETITALAYQATLLSDAGQYKEARHLEEQVLDARRRLVGDHHPDTLDAMANLAATLRAQGELHQARALEEQVLDARRQLLGDHHPHTLTAIASLASTLRAQGELDQARALEEQVLDARRQLLGDHHPQTLTAMANLAATLYAEGELNQARALNEQVLGACRQLLGDHHPQTLTAMANLAATLYAQGELDQARALNEQVLGACRQLLGDHHPETLTAMANLANTLRNQGHLEQAHTLNEQVLDACRQLLGDHHPQTLTAMANLAATLRAQGELHQARALEEQVLDARRRLLGDHHPDTLRAMANLAATLWEQGEKPQARSLLVTALATSERTFGKKHTITTWLAWRLVSLHNARHEAARRKAIAIENLSWLAKEPSNRLTGEQKSIRERVKAFFGGGKSAGRRPSKRKR
ncbi:FxSxx-COOH system tetratricopeptide repeat protein [Microbispora sp. H10836]|uniref:FxSxx-COOH system tetratricopeptide repeat protein n=1 Tax=Microbispora sp. H10836 TaxID=2729106 RepID=UPI001473F65E|nr:FxSxx-COOH system tetratricopeptide repeat protein [Microbispora sp. H10836]